MRRFRAIRRAAMLTAFTTSLLAAGAGVASAHVTIGGSDLTQGGSDALISFRVPTESDSASTVEVQVQLPTDNPIASVLVQPHAGWTAKVTNKKPATPLKTDDGEISQVVSEIDWKANSASIGIKPGQFDQFIVIAGLLPKVAQLTFKTIQTYSDGSETSWIEEAAPGSNAQLEHPAPVLTLAPASADTASPSQAPTVNSTRTGSSASSKGASSGAVTAAVLVGSLGVLLGGAALVLALANRRH